jgi:acyl-CoA synthetase (AMP-forming)/AMP-acid ligase II
MREGLMMDDYPLSLTSVVQRAERFSAEREVVFRRPDGSVGRTTIGACAERARRLGAALRELGVQPGDPVATLLWNQPEHLELYFALPAMGAVIHTLNPRLHPDELSFIVNDAEDRAIVVDESLLGVLESFAPARAFEHVIVVARSEPAPAGMLDYEELVTAGEPMEWPPADERAAAAVCYTSGTTGRPKGVV